MRYKQGYKIHAKRRQTLKKDTAKHGYISSKYCPMDKKVVSKSARRKIMAYEGMRLSGAGKQAVLAKGWWD